MSWLRSMLYMVLDYRIERPWALVALLAQGAFFEEASLHQTGSIDIDVRAITHSRISMSRSLVRVGCAWSLCEACPRHGRATSLTMKVPV